MDTAGRCMMVTQTAPWASTDNIGNHVIDTQYSCLIPTNSFSILFKLANKEIRFPEVYISFYAHRAEEHYMFRKQTNMTAVITGSDDSHEENKKINFITSFVLNKFREGLAMKPHLYGIHPPGATALGDPWSP
jgi:hypothetical protein